jgi:hypothetical protein
MNNHIIDIVDLKKEIVIYEMNYSDWISLKDKFNKRAYQKGSHSYKSKDNIKIIS